ncbi:GNAT family N-acetyltransferase [Vibrio fluvialis]|uniref:GNAT family N-acetyltransferase n=1 Tax=Vibrio fluvialis TaxID=676 RepID=UPI0006904C03|nr:GNAT family N-acetyltransferase [Vibrio fluvialis]EKO3487517.1 GNAT family N-acetyltransferase [Vibrio fluvialis]
MPTLQFEHIDPIKLPLIKRFYKQHYASTKPKSDELMIGAYREQGLCAVVRFRQIAQYRLLTGMAVDSNQRGCGIGLALLNYCGKHILQHNDYCFAYSHLAEFYRKAAFIPVKADALPAELQTLLNRYSSSGKDLIPMQFIP